MPNKNMNDFLLKLQSLNELKTINAEVDPDLEITEIADRIVKKGGPALLFKNVKGSDYPVLVNAFGSSARMALALNCKSLDEIAGRIESLIALRPPEGAVDKLKMFFKLKDMADIFPRKVKNATCQEMVYTGESLLDRLPILRCWPLDGGPFITLPVVITRDPDTGIQNAGMYRMQKFDNRTTGMHWQYNKDGARHYEKHKSAGTRMEVAVALGGIPSVTYAASSPLPPDLDELIFAGFLESAPIDIVRCKTVDLFVPGESDFVIEGYIDPGDEAVEGPFGDHTGFYSPPGTFPRFHVTCITSRPDAVYPATIVGKPPMEDCFMAKATERIFLPLIRLLSPEIIDMVLPVEGVFHNCALVSIQKKYPGQAKKVIHSIWGMGQLSSTKFIIVFDSDIDLNDYSTVVWKLMNNVDPRRDLIITEGPLDELDHSAPFRYFGGKMGIDATRKTKEEGMGREWPDEIRMTEEIIGRVDRRWREYGFS